MNVSGGGSSKNTHLGVPGKDDLKHRRSESGSPAGGPSKRPKEDWSEFLNISPLSSKQPSPSPRAASPAPRSPVPGSAAQTTESQQLHAETWDAHYRANFFTGRAPARAATPPDLSGVDAEWYRIDRPEVEDAFSTLELYDKPDADERTIDIMARELLRDYHPDKVEPGARAAAEEETKKINEAREVAIAYVRLR